MTLWQKIAMDVAGLLLLTYLAVWLSDELHSHTPAAMAGYVWGATFPARLQWIARTHADR